MFYRIYVISKHIPHSEEMAFVVVVIVGFITTYAISAYHH
jgi:hypothetical protein